MTCEFCKPCGAHEYRYNLPDIKCSDLSVPQVCLASLPTIEGSFFSSLKQLCFFYFTMSKTTNGLILRLSSLLHDHASSSSKQLTSGIGGLFSWFSNWLFDWTPFILVLTYYITSTAIYTSASAGTIKVFYFVYMSVNFYIAGYTVVEAFLGISPLREARKAAYSIDQHHARFPTSEDDLPIIDIVIVAYLPNEKDIIKDQVCFALEELVYPREKLRINLGMKHSVLSFKFAAS
jgi:hypothetical protein